MLGSNLWVCGISLSLQELRPKLQLYALQQAMQHELEAAAGWRLKRAIVYPVIQVQNKTDISRLVCPPKEIEIRCARKILMCCHHLKEQKQNRTSLMIWALK